MSGITSDNQGRSSGLVKSTTVAAYDDDKLQANVALLGFKTAVNGSLAKYNLQDQIIDEFTNATGVDTSASTNENLSSGVYNGEETTIQGYAGGNFLHSAPHYPGGGGGGAGGVGQQPASGSVGGTGGIGIASSITGSSVNYAGGGGGGTYAGGTGGSASFGGGAATAGAVGAAATANTGGGGGGGAGAPNLAGGAGGSGIVIISYTTSAFSGTQPAGGDTLDTGVSGYRIHKFTSTGSQNFVTSSGGDITYLMVAGGGTGGMARGGGGGAGGVLSGSATLGTATFAVVVGAGGASMTSKVDPIKGSDTTFNSLTALGGGGGTAEDRADHVNGNGGSGGGGCGNFAAGGTGTSTTAVGDMTLQSLDTTASTANPDYADLVVLMENDEGTATLNTDIKGYISEDSGVTFTQGTFVDEGSWGTDKKIIAFHDLDISAQSGSAMCYKITTHNQVDGSKETKVHAASMGWKA